jgi:signal transduction histidine kinase
VASIENAGQDLRSDSGVQFSVRRSGCDVALQAYVADEIFWVAREALTNAFRHAGASRIGESGTNHAIPARNRQSSRA